VPTERLRRSPRRVGVLALQGDFREHLAALRASEVEGVPVRLATDLQDVDALILPGGESTTMARLMEPALRGLIQRRAAAGMPVMGTCAGMILMARNIHGGRADQEPLKLMDIGVRRNAYGRQIDSFEAEVESTAIGGVGPAVFIRSPQLLEHGAGVEELARLGGQAVAVKEGNRLALAFHPELTPDRRWHQYFLSLGGEAR
jgi:5'-phosphate synthase pdxT subunit